MKMECDDAELLREYVRNHSETAFAALLERHLNFVYSTALRLSRNPAVAEEVCQSVFILLARKANSLRREQVLAGWLYRATCKRSSEFLRTERRRQVRELKALESLHDMTGPDESARQIAALLDEAMASLNEADRNAILLRFFENQPLRAVGETLGINEDAAQKRVARALERMRSWFARRGLTTSTATLAAVVAASTTHLAPATLAASIASSVAATAVTSVSLPILTTKVMSILNLKTGVAVVAGLAAATTFFVQQMEIGKLRKETRPTDAVMAQRGSDSEAKRPADSVDRGEIERLRAQVAEVHRLRGEVSQLRQEKTASASVRAENEQLKKHLQEISRQMASAEQTTPEEEEFRRMGLVKMNHTKNWMLAFLLSSQANEGRTPSSFKEAESLYPNQDDPDRLGAQNPEEKFEIVYRGKYDEIEKPASTIVLREKSAWQRPQGGWAKTYGFADGHSEVHYSPDGNFEPWEKQRMVLAPAR